MSKYLVLYHVEGAGDGPSMAEMFANTPPEQLEAGMKMWGEWMEKCGSAIIDPGAPLHNSTCVTDSASAPSKTTVTGYAVLQAGSLEEATALMQGHPHFFAPGASIQVLEAVAIPGM